MAPVLIGLQVNLCSVELSLYCGSHCVVYPYPEDTWLVHNIPGLCSSGNITLSKLALWEPIWVQETASLGSKVRATSFILLLGVGSFVCYRLFHQLKRRLARGSKRTLQPRAPAAKHRKLSHSQRKYLEYLLYERNDISSISSSDCSDTSSSASYGDRESTSGTPSLSDGDSDFFAMGVSSSNPFEPVYFSKASGIHFRGNSQKSSTPLDHLARNVERKNPSHKCHLLSSNEFTPTNYHKENVFTGSGSFNCSNSFQDYQHFENSSQLDSISYDSPFVSHDAASMHGNFSPGSLRERTRRTEQLISSKLDPKANHALKRDFSVDSLTYNSEQEYSGPASKKSLSRTLSIDSEVSELCVELQRHVEEAHEMGIVTVEKMETLEDEINDIKQTVLELDADLVELKVLKRPPANCWELTNISESEQSPTSELNSSGLVDVIHHHKNKMWWKGLLDVSKTGEGSASCNESNGNAQTPHWDQVCNRMLDWDVSVDNPFESDQTGVDSGSDFGNSLETDSVDIESASVNGAPSLSLEWDTNFVSEFGIHDHDEMDAIPRLKKKNLGSKSTSQRAPMSQSRSLHDDSSHRYKFKKKHRSQSTPSDLLSEQIQLALRKRKVLAPVGRFELGLTLQSPQVSTPMSDVKMDGSPLQDCATSLGSDFTCSSVNAYKSQMSQDESGFQDANKDRTDASSKLDAEAFKMHSAKDEDNNVSQEKKDSNGNLTSPVEKNVNRDSAYYEDSDFPEVTPTENVGPEVDICQYSQEDEKQQAAEHDHLKRKVYAVAEEKLGLSHIRRIRGDNYCVIRATLYQLLSEGLPILQHYGGAAAVYQVLSGWAMDAYPWLLDWTFAENLPYSNNTCLQGFWDCLHSLEKVETALSDITDKGGHLASVLNGNPHLDVQLLEAVKLLMCMSACRLHLGQALTTVAVPVFVMLLFSREATPTPKELVLNRLNKVGHREKLNQVELFLLGYSLSVTLRILHINQFGSQEFISYYPDCNLGSWKEITLVAEDDVHYNVLTR